MSLSMRGSLLVFSLVAIFAAWAPSTLAQDNFYKGKTIRLMVGLAPGGGTDDIPKVLKATLGLPLQLVSALQGITHS
jgi:tripartite-type tricarboxylate transporter receptor subunit TctC